MKENKEAESFGAARVSESAVKKTSLLEDFAGYQKTRVSEGLMDVLMVLGMFYAGCIAFLSKVRKRYKTLNEKFEFNVRGGWSCGL